MSAAISQLSSAITGIDARRVISARPSSWLGGSGCSSTVTPNSFSTGSMPMACLTVHPQLASTRISLSVVSRMARSTDTSSSPPSLTLRMGYSAASVTLARMRSGVSRPMVKVERGALAGSRPHILYRGIPRRFAARSCSAPDKAARAAALYRIMPSIRRSVSSRSNGSEGSAAARYGRAAMTDSAVSP